MTAFLEWLLPLLARIGLDFWTNKPAPVEVVEAEKVGTATQALADVENSDVQIKTAVGARDASAAVAAADPASLRQPDSDSRD